MIFLDVHLPAAVTLELEGAVLALVAWRDVRVCGFYVLPHVVHVPPALLAHQADVARTVRGPPAEGLQVPVWIIWGQFGLASPQHSVIVKSL